MFKKLILSLSLIVIASANVQARRGGAGISAKRMQQHRSNVSANLQKGCAPGGVYHNNYVAGNLSKANFCSSCASHTPVCK